MEIQFLKAINLNVALTTYLIIWMLICELLNRNDGSMMIVQEMWDCCFFNNVSTEVLIMASRNFALIIMGATNGYKSETSPLLCGQDALRTD